MADEAPAKLIQIGPKGGTKKDGFNLVTERVVAVNPEARQLEVELLAYDGKTRQRFRGVPPHEPIFILQGLDQCIGAAQITDLSQRFRCMAPHHPIGAQQSTDQRIDRPGIAALF